MKKALRLLCAAVLISALGAGCNNEDDSAAESAGKEYYWSGGEKIFLDTDYTQMIIGFDSEQELNKFSAANPEARPFIGKAMAIIDVQNDSVTQKLFSEEMIKNKIFAHKFAGYDAPFYLTGDIVMQLKESTSLNDVLAKYTKGGEIVRKTETGIVTVRLNDWNTIFQTANAIYESGMVDWCHPDFITIIERSYFGH
jgi:hypothetical protein